ncbi:MAG: hypothetical protein WKG07_26340 [Hymenobacter sp.]
MTTLFVLNKATRPALALLGLGLGLAGCQTNIDAPSASPGTLDFTSYVAVGNSLTSGYTDGGLYNAAQGDFFSGAAGSAVCRHWQGPGRVRAARLFGRQGRWFGLHQAASSERGPGPGGALGGQPVFGRAGGLHGWPTPFAHGCTTRIGRAGT